MYVAIAVVFALPMAFEHMSARWKPLTNAWSDRILTSVTTIFILGHAITTFSGLYTMRYLSKERLYCRACLMCVNDVVEPDLLRTYPAPSIVRDRVLSFDEAGFFIPRVLKGDIRVMKNSAAPDESLGVFEALTKSSSGEYVARGWALSTNGRYPAASVVLTWTKADGAEVPLAVTWPTERREDLAPKVPWLRRGCGWNKEFNTTLPVGTVIHAWTLDPEKGVATRLEGEQVIK